MKIEFDPAKDLENIRKHGVSLAKASDLDTASIVEDGRFDEPRFRAYGTIEGRPYCLACTIRGEVLRTISLRRAHAKEMRKYAPQER